MQRYDEKWNYASFFIIFCPKKCRLLTQINRCVRGHSYFVHENSSFPTIFVSSTNSAIDSCSGRRVIIGWS